MHSWPTFVDVLAQLPMCVPRPPAQVRLVSGVSVLVTDCVDHTGRVFFRMTDFFFPVTNVLDLESYFYDHRIVDSVHLIGGCVLLTDFDVPAIYVPGPFDLVRVLETVHVTLIVPLVPLEVARLECDPFDVSHWCPYPPVDFVCSSEVLFGRIVASMPPKC